MRAGLISKVVKGSSFEPYRFDPTFSVFQKDGKVVVFDAVEASKKFRVSDFKIQVMLDSGLSPDVINRLGCRIIPMSDLELVDSFVEPKID